MFNWKKLGRIYHPQNILDNPTWMGEYALAPWALIFNNYVKVYFGCRSKDKRNGTITYTAYVDLDRNNLFNIINKAKKPVLKLGNKGSFDEFGTYPLSVIRDKNYIRGYYAGWTRCDSVPFNVGIGYAVSYNDGETFEKVFEGPILPFTYNEPYVLSGPKIYLFNKKYYLFYISGQKWLNVKGKYEISHSIRVATSTDGQNWKKINRNLIEPTWDIDESQASPDVIYSNGKYHMFFCGWIPKSFRHTGSRLIGYASSNDLINWERDDSKVGIGLSYEGWDNKMVAYPHVFELDNEIYMLYIGNDVGREGFGIAVLEGTL